MEPLQSKLTRIALGLGAMGSLVVGLWPQVAVEFDPEKGLAIGIAITAWLSAEWFLSGDNSSRHKIGEHDMELAKAIFRICDEDYFEFLQHHDFGGSWREDRSAPTFELEHKLREARAEFENKNLRRQAQVVKTSLDRFARPLALYSQNVAGKAKIFTVVPDEERATDMFSNVTTARVKELNELASTLANDLKYLLRAVRSAGVLLDEKFAE